MFERNTDMHLLLTGVGKPYKIII